MKPIIIHIITNPDGGGAEKIVQILSSDASISSSFNVYNIYLNNPRSVPLKSHEFSLEQEKLFSLRTIICLRRTLLSIIKNSSDVVLHAHLFQPLYLVPLASACLKTKRVYTEHNTWNRRRNFPILRPIEFIFYLFYVKIFCISFATRNSLSAWLTPKFPSRKLEVIYNGSRALSNALDSQIMIKDSEIRILSIGSLTKQKGFDCSINALSLIRDHFLDYTIIGSGPEREYLTELIAKHNLEGKVHLAGFKSDIFSYIRSSSLGIIPSRWEGFGLVLVEFLSLGLPTVTSSAEGMSEIAEGCPAVIKSPSLHPETLAQTILKGINQLANKPELKKSAIEHSKLFSVSNMTTSYMQSYFELIPHLQ